MDDELREIVEGMTAEELRDFTEKLKAQVRILERDFMAFYLESFGPSGSCDLSPSRFLWN
jgi:hypothetical protein